MTWTCYHDEVRKHCKFLLSKHISLIILGIDRLKVHALHELYREKNYDAIQFINGKVNWYK